MRETSVAPSELGIDVPVQSPGRGDALPVRPGIEAGSVGDSAGQLKGVPRVLGDCRGPESGPTLIIVGGLHGNEPAGVLALQRVFDELARGDVQLRGRFVGLTGNRKALERGQRFLVDDLNRSFWPDRVERLRRTETPLDAEDEEIRDLDREVRSIVDAARGDVFFFDIHTTSGKGGVFTTFDDNLPNREFAMATPVPQVIGLEEELSGTAVGYLNDLGLIAIGFEAGQHKNPVSVDRAEAAIWVVLEAAGLLDAGTQRVRDAHSLLEETGRDLPRVVEVRYRHGIGDDDGFVMRPGYRNFQAVAAGEIVADDLRGPVAAPQAGLMLMPLYQGQGEDGFFIIRPVHFAWLSLSANLRRMRFERFLHWLPGVSRDPENRDGFIVDRRRARWLALQIFHLLGFKRRGTAERTLRMYKRGPRR
jgi:succinylglutamate desuccinylase